MKLIVKTRASATLSRIGKWLEENNTDESGERWIRKIYDYLENTARSGAKFAICRDEDLARKQLRCFTYDGKWVIAYKIMDDRFIVYRFIWGAKLI